MCWRLGRGFPCGSVVKNLPANAGDVGSIPGSGRYPGVGSGNPLQYSCLENSMDRGAWWTVVHGVPWLSASTHAHTCALTRGMPPSPLFAVFLCPAYCWPPNLWYRLTFLTKPPFVSWSEAPDLPPSPSVLSFTILGFLKTDYHCWKWLNLDDPWQALFRGIVTRAFESVYT